MFSPNAGLLSPLTAKGDLWTYTTTDAKLPIGSNGLFLSVDTSTASGLAWASPASSALAVTTVTGAATFVTSLDVMYVNGNGTTFNVTLANPASFPIKQIRIERTDNGVSLPIPIVGLIAGSTNWQLNTPNESYTIMPDSTGAYQLLNHQTATQWATFTPVLSPAFGTPSLPSFFWRRNGENMEVEGSGQLGALGGSAAWFTVPFNLTYNANSIPALSRNFLGRAYRMRSNSAFVDQWLWSDGATTNILYIATTSGNAVTTPNKDNASTNFNSGDAIVISKLSFPVTGWKA